MVSLFSIQEDTNTRVESDGISILYSGGYKHKSGVGIMLTTKTIEAVITWEPVSDRIITNQTPKTTEIQV